MTKNEFSIAEMNEVIARFEGYEKVTVNYFGDIDETDWQRKYEKWMEKVGIESIGDYIVNVEKDKWFEWNDVAYHREWNWLMPVVEKIHALAVAGDAINAITEQAIFTFSIFAPLKDVYTAVYQFITWFNQQPKTNNPKPMTQEQKREKALEYSLKGNYAIYPHPHAGKMFYPGAGQAENYSRYLDGLYDGATAEHERADDAIKLLKEAQALLATERGRAWELVKALEMAKREIVALYKQKGYSDSFVTWTIDEALLKWGKEVEG